MHQSDQSESHVADHPSRRTTKLPKSDLVIMALGSSLILGFTLWVFHFEYRTALGLSESRLSSAVRYRTWTLRNSLQQSQDDVQLLAEFVPTGDLLAFANRSGTTSSPYRASRRQVVGLFANYRKVYEYAAICLFDSQGQVLVQETGSAPWPMVIQSREFQSVLLEVLRSRHYVAALVPASGQELALAFMAPIDAESANQQAGGPLGVVAVLSPLDRELLPLLKGRGATRSGETMLLQLQGAEARYVSPPRFTWPRQGARDLETDTLLRAAHSAVEDHTVFGELIDYRGANVMASMQKIPALTVVVVGKEDRMEALANLFQTERLEAIAAAALALAFNGMILLRRRTAVAREMKTAEESLRAAKETLESKVADRTRQLVGLNAQLHQELGERKRAEDEVRKLNSELDQRVQDRSAQLEKSNKELEAFGYTVSHDLRAPLRAINGFSKILLEEYAPQLTGEAQRYLRTVSHNAEQMGQLIDSLLSFSRLTQQALHSETLAPTDLVRQAWENLEGERRGRKVELKIGDLPKCKGDLLLLRQVFVNLLSNALKYSRTRDIAKIEVGSTESDVYYVRDNGVGFDMRYQDKLFGVFQRLHRSEDFEGTGIGLATVRRIVQGHGGRVWADAVLNQGATFYFTLTSATSNTARQAFETKGMQ
jgi:signal transduction histidine kinase